jgi:hypothetical protein
MSFEKNRRWDCGIVNVLAAEAPAMMIEKLDF